MKEYRPINVLIFLLFTCLLLIPVVFFAPKDGYNIFGFNVRFMTWEKLINPVIQEHKDLSFLSNVNVSGIEDKEFLIAKDSLSSSLGMPSKKGVLAVKSQTQIQMNSESKRNLFAFFEELSKATIKRNKINICHYGDSQIEGDRMTAFIRQRLQTQFGGAGPGLIPVINVYNTISFRHNYSPNFNRKIIFGKEKLHSNKYGILLSSAVFTVDSNKTSNDIPTEAWLEISPSNIAYSRCRAYNNLSVYYNSCDEKCIIEVYDNGALVKNDTLISDGAPHVFKMRFPKTPKLMKIVFRSIKSPVFNGISLEGDLGVQMANIAMRGSSGTSFRSIDFQSMSFMHKALNTKLILLQFGGNSIPYFKDSSSVRSYAIGFRNQIKYVQKCAPNAAVIVIGPSDMSQYQEGIYSTYPFIPYCIQQMKKQSLSVGASFWDLYHAMGGKNAMFAWVDNGLAGKDYVHFTPKGSNLASQLFYDALISAYKQWETSEKKSKAKEIEPHE